MTQKEAIIKALQMLVSAIRQVFLLNILYFLQPFD